MTEQQADQQTDGRCRKLILCGKPYCVSPLLTLYLCIVSHGTGGAGRHRRASSCTRSGSSAVLSVNKTHETPQPHQAVFVKGFHSPPAVAPGGLWSAGLQCQRCPDVCLSGRLPARPFVYLSISLSLWAPFKGWMGGWVAPPPPLQSVLSFWRHRIKDLV